MEQKEIVNRLKGFRREFDDVEAEAPIVLVLSDIADALELDAGERQEVLGKKATKAIEKWSQARVWRPVEPETATAPVKKLVAVPA